MFVNLTDCTIVDDKHKDDEQLMPPDDDRLMRNLPNIHHLAQEKFATMQSSISLQAKTTDDDTKSIKKHFDSRMGRGAEMEEQCRIVPLSSLSSPAFVTHAIPLEENDANDMTALVIKPRREWPNFWLNH